METENAVRSLPERDEKAINQSPKTVQDGDFSYCSVFLIFLFGSIAGFILEGTFCFITKGRWESHVVSVFAPYNILYGLGAALFYIGAAKTKRTHTVLRVIIMTAAATVLELTCGALLRYALGMRAWNYSGRFLNFKGMICFSFSVYWGIAALGFCKLYPFISRALCRCNGKAFKVVCAVLTVFIALDLLFTGLCIFRWSERHYGFNAKTTVEREIDELAPDEWMKNRFIEWRFIDVADAPEQK